MNINFFEHYMRSSPTLPEQKYIFLTDSKNLAINIVSGGYLATTVALNDSGYYTTDTFLAYMDEIAFKGTCQADYCYVPACSTKNQNDNLEQYFRQEGLRYRSGWLLFKNKEYLEKMECQNELKGILSNFIKRFEIPSSSSPDLNRFHKFNEQGKRIGVMDMEIVDYLIQEVPFFILGSTPYVYENGVYCEDKSGICLKAQIQKLLYRDCIKSTTIQSIYNLLVSQPEVQRRFSQLNNQPSHWINFRNGYFDVLSWQFIPHDTKYHMINQIPFSFYPDKESDVLLTGNALKQYLATSLPNQTDQQTFWEYLGYCMTTDTRFQKFLMFKGKGGTGKSIAISLLQHLIGFDNCSSISLQDLNRRFYATGLFGKLVNACADIPSTALQSVDVIKKAVGEDTLLYEKKGQDPTYFCSYAKLVFSANEMPLNLDDKTNAYYRRLLVLDMSQTISDAKKDIHLKEKLLLETDYALLMSLKALQALYHNNTFTESKHSQECIEELYRSADTVKSFLDEKMVKSDTQKIMRSDIYRYYTDYCEENDRQAHGKSVFFRMMKEKGFQLKRSSEGFYYDHLSLSDKGFVELDDTDGIPFEQMKLVTDLQGK